MFAMFNIGKIKTCSLKEEMITS